VTGADGTIGETILRRTELHRSIAHLLIVAVLAGGLPLFSGVVVMRNSVPEFSLDICHPLESATQASPCLIVLPVASSEFVFSLRDRGVMDDLPRAFRSRLDDSPDPPPPELIS